MSETVNVRYMVDDVEAAIAWYTTHLGFSLLSSYAPAFADVQRGALREHWDEVVFLDTELPVATERGVARDREAMGGAAAAR